MPATRLAPASVGQRHSQDHDHENPTATSSLLPRLLSIREVAIYLGVCTKTVRLLIAAGALPTTRVGYGLHTMEADLAAYLA